MEVTAPQTIKPIRLIMTILWSAFLMACVSCGVIFSLLDPTDMLVFDQRNNLSPQATYTIGFIIFWFLGCISSGIAAVLLVNPR